MGKIITSSFAKRKPINFFNGKFAVNNTLQKNLGEEEIPKGALVEITGRGNCKDDFNIKDCNTGIKIHNISCEQLELVEKVGFKIELQDNGQDFLFFTTDQYGIILKAEPFQSDIWEGGYVPVEAQELNKPCMMHHLPHFNRGFLKHNVIAITKIALE